MSSGAQAGHQQRAEHGEETDTVQDEQAEDGQPGAAADGAELRRHSQHHFKCTVWIDSVFSLLSF